MFQWATGLFLIVGMVFLAIGGGLFAQYTEKPRRPTEMPKRRDSMLHTRRDRNAQLLYRRVLQRPAIQQPSR